MNEQHIYDKKIEAQDMMEHASKELKERVGETQQEAIHYAKEKAYAARQKASGYADEITDYIKHYPMRAMTAAALVGVFAGLIVKKTS